MKINNIFSLSGLSGRMVAPIRRFDWKAVSFGVFLLALVPLTTACGSSGGDPTQPANGGATVAPEASPVPTVAGTSKEVAARELEALIQLAQGELTLDTQALTTYSEEVGAVLKRIDSDPDVLQSFQNILEDALGVTFVFDDAASLDVVPTGKVGLASPLLGPFKCSPVDPDLDPFAESKAWLLLRCFMDALFDAKLPASEALNAANPLFATEITKLAVRSQVTNRCINDIDRCVRGDDPVFNKFQQGDFVGAHKAIRGLTTTPELTPSPTRTPMEVPTQAPPPAATLPPAIDLDPTPVPTPSGDSGFSGTWVGRYTGIYTHGFPICGETIPIEGSVTAVLTQTGNQVTGSATLGGSDVLELIQDENGNCSIAGRADVVTQIAATVSGNTLRSAPGLPVVFTMTKGSENSADGTTKDQWLDATFFLGRLR